MFIVEQVKNKYFKKEKIYSSLIFLVEVKNKYFRKEKIWIVSHEFTVKDTISNNGADGYRGPR